MCRKWDVVLIPEVNPLELAPLQWGSEVRASWESQGPGGGTDDSSAGCLPTQSLNRICLDRCVQMIIAEVHSRLKQRCGSTATLSKILKLNSHVDLLYKCHQWEQIRK